MTDGDLELAVKSKVVSRTSYLHMAMRVEVKLVSTILEHELCLIVNLVDMRQRPLRARCCYLLRGFLHENLRCGCNQYSGKFWHRDRGKVGRNNPPVTVR